MVIGRLVLPMKPQKKKIIKFVPKPRVWKLKDEKTSRLFTHEMAARNDEVTKADDIQKKWLLVKETWLKGSKQVCGMTNGPPRHKETWWWNRDVEKVVAKRKVCHKAWQKSKSAEDKHALDVAKKEVYTAVMTAQESKLLKSSLLIFKVNLVRRTDSGLLNRWLGREEMLSACAV